MGTLKMAEFAMSAGLPRPEIEDIDDCVTVRFRHGAASPLGRAEMQVERRDAILALLDEVEEGLSLREIHARFPDVASKRQIRRALTILKNRGLVHVSGLGHSSRWMRGRGEPKQAEPK